MFSSRLRRALLFGAKSKQKHSRKELAHSAIGQTKVSEHLQMACSLKQLSGSLESFIFPVGAGFDTLVGL